MDKQKILIIDDEKSISDVYKIRLEKEGYQVYCAQNGQDGLIKILEGGWNLILLDVMMPILDGIGVLAALKENQPKQNNGPIVMMTNLSEKNIIDKVICMGACGCLNKSELQPHDIPAKVASYLKQ